MSTAQERKKIINLYGLFGSALLLSVLPNGAAAFMSLLFFAALMVMAYRLRRKSEHISFSYNHTTFVIRTFWISALLATVTMIAGTVYMLSAYDPLPFQPCANSILNAAQNMADTPDLNVLYMLSRPCMGDFISTNMQVFLVSGAIMIIAPLLYISYRFIKGLSRAVKGYRIADPHSWL